MTDLLDLQYAREEAMRERGEHRAKSQIAKTLERGEAAETPAGIALAKRTMQPLIDAIETFKVEANTGKAGRRNVAAVLLEKVPTDLAAYLTIRCLVAGCARRYALKSTALHLTERLQSELIGGQLEASEPALYNATVRNAKRTGKTGTRMAGAVKMAVKKRTKQDPNIWTHSQRILLGTKLIELAIEALGIAAVEQRKDGRRVTYKIHFTPAIEAWFKNYNDAASLIRPFYLPAVVPPKRWDAPVGGAYYSSLSGRNTIITRCSDDHLDRLKNADMAPVYKAINALQETRWAINKRVLEVMEQMWESPLQVSCMPPREDTPIPTPPKEVQEDEKGGEIRRAWRRKVRTIHETNAKDRSKRFEFRRAMILARENATQPAIYFPHRLDFRGRAYSASTTLNPQGSDDVKGLLMFAEGKPLGERGLFWLGVHGANLFGNDKVSLEERYEWARGVVALAHNVNHDPLSNLWWTEADSPWQFLAWCIEWSNCWHSSHQGAFVSHLPIGLDGSCNGIQHFSAMLRDPVGGAAVNLIPGGKPNDIYGRVAGRTTELLQEYSEDASKVWIAEGWVTFGIDRKITKRAVMVLPYGGTFRSCVEYVREAVQEKIDGGAEHPFGENLQEATLLLASLVWKAIGDVVIAARAAMGWLQGVARVCNKTSLGMAWTTPSGFPVLQRYKAVKENRIQTRFQGSMIYFRSVEEEQHKLDTSRQVSAVSPNFVHSLDAAALTLTINECQDRGVHSFAMVHDSYATHAADTDLLGETLRDVFVRMYTDHDVLAAFRDEIAAQLPEKLRAELPELPEKGTLDLEAIRQSTYFFA